MQNIHKNTLQDFFKGKLETFLTCLHLIEFMRDKIDEPTAVGLEKISLKAIQIILSTEISLPESQLLIAELPNILPLKYPVVDDILQGVLQIIPPIKDAIQNSIDKPEKMMMWRDFCELDYILELLKTFEIYREK